VDVALSFIVYCVGWRFRGSLRAVRSFLEIRLGDIFVFLTQAWFILLFLCLGMRLFQFIIDS
jgi:hypothetical protein